ncbi:unnamed protein product, partial [Dibothriocephalus latus]
MKRVEPHELEAYKKLGKSLVPLPTPRESEANELYVTLERWVEASVFTERTTQHHQAQVTLAMKDEKDAREQVFMSRLQLNAPVSSERHGGKYVVMTMSRANLKSIEYGVVYVKVIPKPFITSTHNVIVYFVVPIGFIILAICGLVYFLLCRRSRVARDSADQAAPAAHSFGNSSFFSQGGSSSG